jgi:hypothetical protein
LETVAQRRPNRNFTDFGLFNFEPNRRICSSTRCAAAANAIGSDTDIFSTSSISINDLQVLNTISLAEFSFNLGKLLAINLLIFFTFLPLFR